MTVLLVIPITALIMIIGVAVVSRIGGIGLSLKDAAYFFVAFNVGLSAAIIAVYVAAWIMP
jgi:hypothetical protein